jgi:rubrerythrin
MDFITALSKMEKIEYLASQLYKHYHTLFLNDEEASYFFYKMSIEEKGHRNLVQYVKRLVRQNSKLFTDIDIDCSLFEKLEKKLEEEINRRPHPTLLQAIDATEEIEITIGEGYIRNLPLARNSILTDLYNSLGEKDHTEKITAFRTKINARI